MDMSSTNHIIVVRHSSPQTFASPNHVRISDISDREREIGCWLERHQAPTVHATHRVCYRGGSSVASKIDRWGICNKES